MVTAEELLAHARTIGESADLSALLAHLRERARPLLAGLPPIPEHKALLSADGGVCPDDGTRLTFDPWQAHEHHCPRCGKTWRGDRHDRCWACFQHLWLAERAAHLAALAAVGGSADQAAAVRSREILTGYAERYWRYPNRDNVLGPARLFFSTYLESLWTCNYLAAATLLRAAGQLDDASTRGVNQVAEEAATIIGDYDEMFSNRQTWNNAALTAVAVWFEDEDLAQRVIEGETGLIAHLLRGYGRDGLWYEGENYHLFALRGLLTGATWARLAGVDFWADERLSGRLEAALKATALTALPDFTFPARKDARFGQSLAQPAYLEVWEIGLARGAGRAAADGMQDVAAWLQALYDAPAAVNNLHESYLHDAPVDRTPRPPSRSSLSWWSLLEMLPALPADAAPWQPRSVLLESQGLAILRRDNRYVSLECGPYGGGHGHPDRLQLTLHADGIHWLPDPGTGEYVTRDLFWYRSTLAHNAPRLDGQSQPLGSANVDCFDQQENWEWMRGRFESLSRAVMAGPAYLVDVVDLISEEEHILELPWHVAGRSEVQSKGRWVSDELADEFVTRVQCFVPDETGPVIITHAAEGRELMLHLMFEGELLELEGPGVPGQERATFYVVRARGRNARLVTVIEPRTEHMVVRAVRARGDSVEVDTANGRDRHRFTRTEWTIEQEGQVPRTLRGVREARPPFVPLLEFEPPTPVAAPAFRVAGVPALDGTLDGFDTAEPFHLGLEDQYRRSEDPYPGPDEFSAEAYAAWDETALYLAVDVAKPDLCLRPADAPPLRLDNEPDDIHSDGLQLYVSPRRSGDHGHDPVGYLIVPDAATHGVRARLTSDTRNHGNPEEVRGGWRRSERGYCVTVALPWPPGVHPHAGAQVGFDLIVNELLPGRMRRVGQLVWSGGGGWVWLRGDRQDPARFGALELVG
ncbi:MAG: heparinase II/III family protein [Gemmatimonadales bacterium]